MGKVKDFSPDLFTQEKQFFNILAPDHLGFIALPTCLHRSCQMISANMGSYREGTLEKHTIFRQPWVACLHDDIELLD